MNRRTILENPMHPMHAVSKPKQTLLFLGALIVLAVVLLFDPGTASAQTGPGTQLGQQSMRPYAHVFWAYALAWAIVLGWVISIGRRWSRVEDELGEGGGRD